MFLQQLKGIFKDISNFLKFNITSTICDNSDISLECHKLFVKYLQNNEYNIIGYISKKEDNIRYLSNIKIDETKPLHILAFSPLDGISNYTTNINCGSIYGIYTYDNINKKLINIIDSGYCLYSINTLMVYTNNNRVTMDILNGWNTFIRLKDINFDNNPETKTYSINHSGEYDPELRFLIQHYKKENYKLRWVGSLTADIHRILMTDGIFYYPSSTNHPSGKIHLLYESMPMAYIFKLAGGIGTSLNYKDILLNIGCIDMDSIHRKSTVILASNNEYIKLLNLLESYEANRY